MPLLPVALSSWPVAARPVVGRLRIGRAIRNVYDGVMAGEAWAIGLAVCAIGVAVVVGAYFAYRAHMDSNRGSKEVELTAEEKNLMNRF